MIEIAQPRPQPQTTMFLIFSLFVRHSRQRYMNR